VLATELCGVTRSKSGAGEDVLAFFGKGPGSRVTPALEPLSKGMKCSFLLVLVGEVVLGFELRALCLVHRWFTVQATHLALFCLCYFSLRVSPFAEG
jgi:hypothetical protein